jgi:hypothetical protein
MRSPQEFWFRLRQEFANLDLAVHPPRLEAEQSAPLALLPPPERVAERLRGTPLEAEILALAEKILAHRFPLLGVEIETGPRIDWRRDYLAGIETRPVYFRRVPYLDRARAGDHKIIWELNRHQHLVVLAQALLLSGDKRFDTELQTQFESWESDNPLQRGINWASALEIAFRVLSWIWVYHLIGAGWDAAFRRRFLLSLYRHGCHLTRNLSIYFSPNTHLLGEAVALHALGVLFPAFPRAAQWASLGASLVREQMRAQVRDDGSHFEQSTYYQIYAVDFFLLHDVLAPQPEQFRRKLGAMAEYLHALHTSALTIPFLGDDDGGRLFHPYGPRNRFGAATLAACAARLGRPGLRLAGDLSGPEAAWWLPDPPAPAMRSDGGASSRLFRQAGIAVLSAGDSRIVVDAGPFGAGNGGHSHSDTLSVVAFCAGRELLIDPGTYSYTDRVWRDRFRGSAAHNTVRLDSRDQAVPSGPFSWQDHPNVEILAWEPGERSDALDAACRYGGFRHSRRIRFHKPDRLWILDELEGPPGRHDVEQFWHLGLAATESAPGAFLLGDAATLWLPPGTPAAIGEGGETGWRSTAPGEKHPMPVLRVHLRSPLPLRLGIVLDWRPATERLALAPADAAFLQTLQLND